MRRQGRAPIARFSEAASARRASLSALLALALPLALSAAPAAAAEPCPNQAIREEQHSAYLPDCRAYEQVSPPAKNGSDVTGLPTRVRAAVNGNGVQYSSLQGFGDVHGISVSTDYLAVRQPGGWANHAITPTFEPGTLADALAGLQSRYLGDLSSDLSRGVFVAKSPLTEAPNVALAVNLYLRDDLFSPGIRHYQLLTNAETLQGADSSPSPSPPSPPPRIPPPAGAPGGPGNLDPAAHRRRHRHHRRHRHRHRGHRHSRGHGGAANHDRRTDR